MADKKVNPKSKGQSKRLKSNSQKLNQNGKEQKNDEDGLFGQKQGKAQIEGSQFQQFYDYTTLELKEDYRERPILICPDGIIFLETFNPLYRVAYQFLISIGEPVQRPLSMHKFTLTKYSLYTAMVLQYEPKDIILCLEKLSKNKKIPKEVESYIIENTQNYGAARLFLDDTSYYLDIDSKVWANIIDKNPQIKDLVSQTEFNFDNIINQNKELRDIQKDLQSFFQNIKTENNQLSSKQNQKMVAEDQDQDDDEISKKKQIQNDKNKIVNDDEDEEEDSDDEDEFVYNFIMNNKTKRSFKRIQIIGDHFEVTKAVINCSVPLIQEYDFENKSFKQLEIDLKPKIKVRYYQERALKNIFIQKKARSGLIILPCGAGKTIVGVIAIERIKQSTVIICDSDVSVDQWRDELERWTTINKNKIVRLTGRIVDEWPTRTTDEPIIVITTYYMLVKKREDLPPTQIAQKSKKRLYIDSMKERKWGVCVIDEVHKLPANTFQNVLKQYKFHFKLGLTATPYREDEKIINLFYMIGPKLYEENWYDLVSQGFLAKPYCVEIRCEMTQLWMSEYNKKDLKTGKNYYRGPQRELIHTSNPRKFKTLEYLIKVHEERGDKILVFCDRPMIIDYYGNILKYPVIYGDVSQDERKKIFNLFKVSNQINTIFLSRVGDTAIDLPQANVGIQIGMHFKSRRQEVQRLGRIMRAKENYDGQYNAFWYTLVSKGTDETSYCLARQKCLINQGFKYEIIDEKDLPYSQNPQKFKWMSQLDESDYLYTLLMNSEQNQQNGKISSEEEEENSSDDSSGSDSEESEGHFNITTRAANPLQNLALYKETQLNKH
ncbi:hypothetical protein ABPG72_004383 [Tetrahymena utriculariae]